MIIADVLNITGGRTNVVIYGIDENDGYMELWKGQVDDIDFSAIPYGCYEVQHMTVINDEDILQLHFKYPELTDKEKDIINKESVGYPYPTDWIEKLFIKYRNLDKIKEILIKSKEEVYDEVRIDTEEKFTTEVEKVDRITINRWSSGYQGHGIDVMIESGDSNRIIYKGSMNLDEFAKCITAQASCKIVTEIE